MCDCYVYIFSCFSLRVSGWFPWLVRPKGWHTHTATQSEHTPTHTYIHRHPARLHTHVSSPICLFALELVRFLFAFCCVSHPCCLLPFVGGFDLSGSTFLFFFDSTGDRPTIDSSESHRRTRTPITRRHYTRVALHAIVRVYDSGGCCRLRRLRGESSDFAIRPGNNPISILAAHTTNTQRQLNTGVR